jgi:hypothetical protein
MRASGLLVLLALGVGACSSSSSETTGGSTTGGSGAGSTGGTTGASSGTSTGGYPPATASWTIDGKKHSGTPTCTSFSGPPFTGTVSLGDAVTFNFYKVTLDAGTDAGLGFQVDCQGAHEPDCVDARWGSLDAGCGFIPSDCLEDSTGIPCPASCYANTSSLEVSAIGESSGMTTVRASFNFISNGCAVSDDQGDACANPNIGTHTASGTFTCEW